MLGSSPAVARAADPAAIRRDWATFGSVLMERQTALRELYPAATSVPRAVGSLVALGLALGGSFLLHPGIAGEPRGPLQAPVLLVAGILLVVLGAVLAVLLGRAGGPAVRGTLAWAVLPSVVTDDGRRQRGAGPLTLRQHQAVEEVGRLLTPGPVRIRHVGALLALLAAVGTTVLAVGPLVDQTRAYANDATLGALVAALVRAGACWWLAVAAGLGAWRLTAARNGGTGPGGQAARVWTLRRAGVDVSGGDPAGEEPAWTDRGTVTAVPEPAGPDSHGGRLRGGGAYASAAPGEWHPEAYRSAPSPAPPGAPGHPPAGQVPAGAWHPAGPVAPPAGDHPGRWQEAPTGAVQGGPDGRWHPATPPPAGRPGPDGYGHAGYGPDGYGPAAPPAAGAGAPGSFGTGPGVPGPGATGPGATGPGATGLGATGPGAPTSAPGVPAGFGTHRIPAWRETGEWEEVPDVRVGGYLLDGGVTLVGRDPTPRGGEIVDNLMVVPDPRMSKTHLSVRLGAHALSVIDRGSTNGTFLLTPDDAARRLQPWQEVEVPVGTALRLGDSLLEWDSTWEDDEDDAGQTVLR